LIAELAAKLNTTNLVETIFPLLTGVGISFSIDVDGKLKMVVSGGGGGGALDSSVIDGSGNGPTGNAVYDWGIQRVDYVEIEYASEITLNGGTKGQAKFKITNVTGPFEIVDIVTSTTNEAVEFQVVAELNGIAPPAITLPGNVTENGNLIASFTPEGGLGDHVTFGFEKRDANWELFKKGFPTTTLDALSNVDATGKADGDTLAWDETEEKWVAVAPGGSGSTNLTATPTPTTVVIESDTGTDATIGAADGTNAGLLLPAEKTKITAIDQVFTAAEKSKLAGVVEHWRGKYISLAALEAAITTGNDGDYATVDPGGGTDASNYNWDAEEGWVLGSGTGAVASVFGRTGPVSAQSGDYTASQITNTPAGNIASTTVQAAINELDTEKEPTFSKNTAFNKDIASTGEALAGSLDNVLMTPLKTQQKIDASLGSENVAWKLYMTSNYI
jgi:hypothetical protein